MKKKFFFHVPDYTKTRVVKLLPKEPFVLIHPVSRWMFKALPHKNIAKVISYLHERGKKVVLTSSSDPKEIEMNSHISQLFPGITNLSGKISLKEFGAVLEKALMLITVDSLPLHLASALAKPTVAIFGPTCDQNWGPWNNPYARVIKMPLSCRPCFQPGCGGSGHSHCIMDMPVKLIIDSVHKLLQSVEN